MKHACDNPQCKFNTISLDDDAAGWIQSVPCVSHNNLYGFDEVRHTRHLYSNGRYYCDVCHDKAERGGWTPPLPLDDMPPTSICRCVPTVDPDEPTEEATHHLRRCQKCKRTWLSLHCPHDGYQNECPYCHTRAQSWHP